MTSEWPALHASQTAALEHVTRQARLRRELVREQLREVLAMSDIASEDYERGLQSIRDHARVLLHFHPDRPDDQLRSVAQNLLACGCYKSQFETQLSNGSVSAFPGGARDEWERKLFGGAYHGEGVSSAHRPKYGALDLLRHGDGASPRFGSCYFVLAPAVSARSTFTYLDSHQDPLQKGTLEALDDVLTALFHDAFSREWALGEPELRPARLLEQLLRLSEPYAAPAARAPRRNLDHYIEAQVHGEIRLERDVELLVADPSVQGTETGEILQELAERYAFRLLWHAGFWLAPAEVPRDFRGPGMPTLAARVAQHGRVDAAAIGVAANALERDPASWPELAGIAPLQQLKLLWHVLVRYGRTHA